MNQYIMNWIEEQAKLTKPDKIRMIKGTPDEIEEMLTLGITQEKVNGVPVFTKLNHEAFPNSYFHRSHLNDVARTENLTYICLPRKEDAGINNNWMEPEDAKKMLYRLFDGCMQGRTMYVIPCLMGHPGSSHAMPCVQLTDSVYVVVNMCIMTRVGDAAVRLIGENDKFVRGLHSMGDLDPDRRFIMHFPQESLVMSIGSGYGGNALLGKKSFSLRIASYKGFYEGWLAEHMMIIGVENPEGKVRYFIGGFPSACGKTNLAMLESNIPGYKVHMLGDDIAWLNRGSDGRLYAMNPETGIFGVAPGTTFTKNPNMMRTLLAKGKYPTLFTNTALNLDNNTPWWEGLTDEKPLNMVDWMGNVYGSETGKNAAHPNSRFTVSLSNCPSLSSEYDNPSGVPISGIIFGSRRSSTIPLVYESMNWEHGVFSASSMGSETTSAIAGKEGVVRRDPMAMLPFCGYNMVRYFKHWLSIGLSLSDAPAMFFVNWFRRDDNGKFLWPGFRENSRIIKWIFDRIDGKVSAFETPIGKLPYSADINLEGLNISNSAVNKLFEINKDEWRREAEEIENFYKTLGKGMPEELLKYLENLKKKVC